MDINRKPCLCKRGRDNFPILLSLAKVLLNSILTAIVKHRLTYDDFFGCIVVDSQLREYEKLFGAAGLKIHFSGFTRSRESGWG